VFTNFAGDACGNKSSNKKNDGIETDIRLRDGGTYTRSGRAPAKIVRSGEIRNSGGEACEQANTRVQAKDRENDKNKKDESGRAGDGTVGRLDARAAKPSEADGRNGSFQNGGSNPVEAGEFLAGADEAVADAQHEVFVGGDDGGEGNIPAGVFGVEGGVKKEDAGGEYGGGDADKEKQAEDTDAFAAKFGETKGFGIDLVRGHRIERGHHKAGMEILQRK